jgi:hypothetical protein
VNKRFYSHLAVIVIICGALVAVANRQTIMDWWRLGQYAPSNQIKLLADNTTMQGRGRDMFYVSDPQIQASADFNESCAKNGEATIVLGCYKSQQIYLFNVTDPKFNGVLEVTAAHEMLHAAYERLSSSDKEKLNAQLKPVIEGMKDQHILELIDLYNKAEPGELYNEMHSILGTEYANLTPELEDHYKQYFADRSKAVAYAAQYQAIFIESQKKIADYDAQLASLKSQIDQNNQQLQQQQTSLQSQGAQLDQLKAQGQARQHNQLVPEYNAQIDQFNSLVRNTRSLVEQYNQLVAERNQQAAAQDNLYQSLNSDYQTATQQ